MQQSEREKVWIFRGRVQMFLNALRFDPSSNVSNGEQCRVKTKNSVCFQKRERERERITKILVTQRKPKLKTLGD